MENLKQIIKCDVISCKYNNDTEYLYYKMYKITHY